MNYPIIVCPFLKVNGMAIFPFILVREKAFKHDAILIRHETIHLRQELELLVIPFYMAYLFNYLINLARYRDKDLAYLNIIFEREAYMRESDIDYLEHRPLWGWLNYWKNKS